MATYATRTVGGLLAEARGLLNDVLPISGEPRFTDSDLVEILNEALLQVRAKRPDAWLTFGLRRSVPRYVMPDAASSVFPIEDQFYSPILFYVVGRAELVEDTFADNGRAITMIGKFTAQLLKNAG
jgi:hypothetical protein